MRTIRMLPSLLALTGALSLSACMATVRPGPGAVYVRTAPPPPVYEVYGPRPGPAYVWIPGHHEWRGNAYVWIGGRYELPVRGYRRYEPGRWVQSRRDGWFWVEGRWR